MKRFLGFLLSFFTLFFSASHIITYLISNRNANLDFMNDKEKESDVTKALMKQRSIDYEWLLSQPNTEHTIISEDGYKLKARLYKASIESETYAFCVHGFHSHGRFEYATIAKYYLSLNINVFLVDLRASGDSGGKYITFGKMESRDCFLWLKYLEKTLDKNAKIFLHGISMGSATVQLMSKDMLTDNVKFIIADCGYSSTKKQLLYSIKTLGLPAKLFYFLYKHQCKILHIYDPDKCNPIEAVKHSKVPIIVSHGTIDDMVPYENGEQIYRASPNANSCFISVPDANHTECFPLSKEVKKAILEMLISNSMV